MSGSHSSGEGKTNIERKVLRNTLISNSNYLKYKDESTSRPSGLSMSSKLLNSVTNSRNILSMDITNLNSDVFSISQSMQNFLFKPDLDPSHSETQLYTDIFLNSLYDILNASEPGATVTLPDKHIILGDLHLSVPIILKGAPGTILEIRGGTITVDLDDYEPQQSDEQPKLVLCEMSIVFNYNGFSSDSKHPTLFNIEARNTFLEVRDCDIKSVSNELQNVTEEFREIYDICFFISGNSRNTHKQGNYNSRLVVKSCNISNFFEVARAGVQSSLSIEKAHFTQTTGSCINLKSPREFNLISSVIEKAAKCGVVIKFTENSIVDTPKLSRKERELSTVKMDGNEIRGIGACGVLISAENKTQSFSGFLLSNNKITNCKQDAIAIRQVVLQSLEISSNDLNCNSGTSIWLQKVSLVESGRNILLSYNRCFDSYAGYGIYLYDTCAELENNECFRNNLGGLMIVGSPIKEATGQLSDLLIKNCTIHTNGENGITILDYLKGSIKISTCKIHENYHNGVYLLQSRESTPTKRHSDKVVPTIGDLLIENSEIFLNKLYGITLSKILCTISATIISDNQEGAISLDEESRKLLKFKDEDETQLRKFIQGSIGGEWGKLYQEKKKGCGNNDCMLL
jgi:hypothetical protein